MPEKYWRIAWAPAIAGGISIAVPLGVFFLRIANGSLSGNPSHWGVFGDYIGGFSGTIISLITLVALAINIHLQARELEATRNELKATRTEMDLQRKISHQQVFDAIASCPAVPLIAEHGCKRPELCSAQRARAVIR